MFKYLRWFGVLSMIAIGTVGLLSMSVLAHKDADITATIKIDMGEMFFQADGAEQGAAITVKGGDVIQFNFENVGEVIHDVHFGRAPNLIERTYDVNLFPGFDSLVLEPGETATIILTILSDKAGEWEIGCFQLGHYETGQKSPFIIE